MAMYPGVPELEPTWLEMVDPIEPQLQDAMNRVTLTPSELLSGAAGYPLSTRSTYPVVEPAQAKEPSWIDRTLGVMEWAYNAPSEYLGEELGGDLRDGMLQKWGIIPQPDGNVNPRDEPARGQTPIATVPKQTVYWPWQTPPAQGDYPMSTPAGQRTVAAIGGSSIVLIGLGLAALFLLGKK